jgi:rhodanese-related sulfurtransferase
MKNVMKYLLVALISIATINCNMGQTDNKKEQEVISEVLAPKIFKEKITENTQLVDVRTPAEYNTGYIDGAINFDFKNKGFLDQIRTLDKSKPVYLYCRSGKRSAAAAKMIASEGFEVVYDLKGGILNWQKNEFKTIK